MSAAIGKYLQVFEPEVGMPVAALYSDNVWYRGEIIEIVPDKLECVVMFVDYGNVLSLTMDKMRYLKTEYLVHYVPTMRCRLFGVKIDDSNLIKVKNFKTLF